MDGYIYVYTNKINNKRYVGKTINIKRRINEHQQIRGNSVFHSAIKKYGIDNFYYEIIEHIKADTHDEIRTLLDQLESNYIKLYRSNEPSHGYNLTTGGEGASGAIRSQETRKLMSESKKGDKNPMKSNESKQKMIASLKKHYESHEHPKMSESNIKTASERMMGDKNPMYGRFGNKNPSYGRNWTLYISKDKYEEFCAGAKLRASGKNNPMYGRSAMKGKHYEQLKWIDEYGNIQIMSKKSKNRWHPNWVEYKEN